MAVLISPSNNSGWGLGVKGMYGGAKILSESHPVRVLKHYRAAWGSRKGRVIRRQPMRITNDPVADVVAAIGPGRRKRGRKGRRGRRMRITSDPVADVVRAIGRRRKKGRKMRRTSNPVMDVVRAIGRGRRRRKGSSRRKGGIIIRKKNGRRTIIVKEGSSRYKKRWSKLPRTVMYHPSITANPARYQKRKRFKSEKRVIYPKVRYPPTGMQITDDPVMDVVNAVAASTAARAPAADRVERHTRMRITADPVADVVNAVAAGTARRRAAADSRRRNAREAAQNARRNIYLVRNADGVRVPVTQRPS